METQKVLSSTVDLLSFTCSSEPQRKEPSMSVGVVVEKHGCKFSDAST